MPTKRASPFILLVIIILDKHYTTKQSKNIQQITKSGPKMLFVFKNYFFAVLPTIWSVGPFLLKKRVKTPYIFYEMCSDKTFFKFLSIHFKEILLRNIHPKSISIWTTN